MLLTGVVVLLFPTFSAWLSQYELSQRIVAATADVESLTPEERGTAFDRAVAYNEALPGGNVRVTPGERFPLTNPDTEDQEDYFSLLNADKNGLMGRIKIPSIKADLPIYHGTTDDVLASGVGHLQGSALPVGGEGMHSVLTAHRGLATAELFTHLDEVKLGDTFTLEIFGEVLSYEVFETQVVRPEDTQTLNPIRGRDFVTLVTCTPLGINTHRILVTAERIFPTPQGDLDAAGADPEVPGFPWWIYGLAAAVAFAALFVWHSGRGAKLPVASGDSDDGEDTEETAAAEDAENTEETAAAEDVAQQKEEA